MATDSNPNSCCNAFILQRGPTQYTLLLTIFCICFHHPNINVQRSVRTFFVAFFSMSASRLILGPLPLDIALFTSMGGVQKPMTKLEGILQSEHLVQTQIEPSSLSLHFLSFSSHPLSL
jgi:hypothetical protein